MVGVLGTYDSLPSWIIGSPLILALLYVIIALPYSYRAIDAGVRSMDLHTLVEAGRSMGAGWVAPEHLFLAMLHDGGWPVSVLTGAGLIDANQVEIAVVAAMNAPGYTPTVGAPLAGGRTAGALCDSYIGLEHVFLEIIGDRAGLRDGEHLVELVELVERPASASPPKPAGNLEGGVGACGDSRSRLVEAPAVVVDELVDPGMHARRH